jgi:hypothetical protein
MPVSEPVAIFRKTDIMSEKVCLKRVPENVVRE